MSLDIVSQRLKSRAHSSCIPASLRRLVRIPLLHIPTSVSYDLDSYRNSRRVNRSSSTRLRYSQTVRPTTNELVFVPILNGCVGCSEFQYDKANESSLAKELTLQVRKVIGPFAAPKKIYIVNDLPKTRSGKVKPYPLL